MRPITAADITTIETDHELLTEKLQSHQEALLSGEYASALVDFQDFARLLHRHIRLEDQIMLPAYENLGNFSRIGHPEFFRKEHRKIEEELGALNKAVRELRSGADRASILRILEREMRFKSLLSHHQKREDQSMLPRLKEHLSAGPQPSTEIR